MSDPFLSSEDYAERAHQLYNEGRYDDAIEVIRDGLEVYPFCAELLVGMGYARLAREEYAWARQSFEDALGFDPDHEDGLVGFGETLLRIGQPVRAVRCFERILVLGFRDDHDLVLQAGRALFREGAIQAARRFFEIAVEAHTDSAEAVACLGYALHRLGEEREAIRMLRVALDLDEFHTEARVYLGNVLYDRGELESALYHFERTEPEDHLDELAIWRLVELKKSIYRLPAGDPELTPWSERLAELGQTEPIDRLLGEIEATQPDGSVRDPAQLELFGTLLLELEGMQHRRVGSGPHRVTTITGRTYVGTWEEIVLQMKQDDPRWADATLGAYMADIARRSAAETGVRITATDAEAFVFGSAAAGLLRIVR